MTRFKLLSGAMGVLLALYATSAPAAQHTTTVPFTAVGQATLTPSMDGTLNVSGTGEATHLGHYVVSGTQVFQLGLPPTFVGDITMTAANGDELYITVTGVLTGFFPNPAGNGQYEITGGTGRFEGASGTGSFDANTERALYEGSITFAPGSKGNSES
ncbi:MAG: hypothetical protein PVJ49_07205 [Acidobacteriota bacterium]|jgi:hypothetical protein